MTRPLVVLTVILCAAVSENAKRGRRAMGDGGYLFDPRGNLRAAAIHPSRGQAFSA